MTESETNLGKLLLKENSWLFIMMILAHHQVHLPDVKEGELLVSLRFNDVSLAKLLMEQYVARNTLFF